MGASWQQEFAAAVLAPGQPAPGFVRGRSEKRFAVYRNNVILSLTQALAANFPAIQRLVGEAFFAGLAKAFICDHPPQSRLLVQYGKEFPAFLEKFAPLAQYVYMPHVARLEIAWLEACHEADARPLDGADLAGLSPDRLAALRFVPHPATRLLAFPCAAVTIMTANRNAGPLPAITTTLPEYGLVTRPFLDVQVGIISGSAHTFLSHLLVGHGLGDAAGQALESHADFDLAANLQAMLAAGAFFKVR